MPKLRPRKPKGWKSSTEPLPNEPKRQQKRRTLRQMAFLEITGQYGGESRRQRRSMASAMGKRRYGAKTDVRP